MLLLAMLTAALPAEASNVDDRISIAIQSTKTLMIRPLEPNERDILSVYQLIYEPLIRINDNYLPESCLCETWEPTGNGKTWTFHLRSGITFSDGTPLTAKDVVATAQYILDRARDEATVQKGFYQNLRYFVKSISAKDELTVQVKADRSYYGILYAMTFPILPADRINQDNPPGTGPYMITSFEPGNHIYLDYNPLWWKNAPQVKHVNFFCYPTPQKAMEKYEYANVDAVFTRSVAAAQYKNGTSSVSLDYRTSQLEVLILNESYAKLKSVNVRKAIRAAVNPDKIASSVYLGMVTRTDFPTIPGTWMYPDSFSSVFVTNAAEARRLMEEDGWGDSNEDGIWDKLTEDGTELLEMNLNLYVYEEPDNDVRIEAANLIKDQLDAVGFNVTVIVDTYTGMQDRLTHSSGNCHLVLCSFSMDVCPDPGFLLTRGNTGNYGRYKSAQMDDLVKELRTCATKDAYQSKLMQIWALFVQDCPLICLYYRGGTVLSRLMYTTVRDIREYELMRGIEEFKP